MTPNTNVAAATIGPRRYRSATHGHDAQDEESTRNASDEDNCALAYMKRLLDIGSQDGQSRTLQIVQGDDDGQNEKCAEPDLGQAIAERRLLFARSRQEFLGQEDILN